MCPLMSAHLDHAALVERAEEAARMIDLDPELDSILARVRNQPTQEQPK